MKNRQLDKAIMTKTLCAAVLLTGLLAPAAIAQYDPNHFDPDNAAHWYRKAFALYEKPDEMHHWTVEENIAEIEQFVNQQKPVIDLIKKAVQTEKCDWEYENISEFDLLIFLESFDFSSRHDILSNIKKFTILLLYKSDVERSKGNLEEAIKSCHLALSMTPDIYQGDSISLLGMSANRSAVNGQFIKFMNHSDFDKKHLMQIRQILNKQATYPYPTYSSAFFDDKIKFAETNFNKKFFINNSIWGIYSEHFDLFEEDFYKRNGDYYITYLRHMQELLKQPFPDGILRASEYCDEVSSKLEQYMKRFEDEKRDYMFTQQDIEYVQKCDYLIAGIFRELPDKMIGIEYRTNNQLNAMRAAIKLYQIYYKTNHLPERMPLSCPKDLYSGKPFELIKTDDGFILKCQGKEINSLGKEKYYEYEFKLPTDKD